MSVVADIQVFVDWDRAGNFDGPEDNITRFVQTASWGNGARKPFQSMADEARARLTLRNDDQRFSPENITSPLYDLIRPQRPLKIRARHNGIWQDMYTGWLESVQPAPFVRGEQNATAEATGAKQFLQDTEIYLDLQENVTADEVIQLIMEQVIFPPALAAAWILGAVGNSELGISTFLTDTAGTLDLDAGNTVFSYVADNWDDGVKAYKAIRELVDAERGRFFFDRSGVAVFWNRHFLPLNTAIVHVFEDLAPIETYPYAYGENVRNDIRVKCSPRKISGAGELLWESDNDIELKAGETKTIRASFADDSGAKIGGQDVVVPSTGAGTLVYSGGPVAVAMETAARSAKLTLINSGITATITTLQIKGKKMTSWGTQEATAFDGISVAKYGKRTMSLDPKLLDDFDQAQRVASWELVRRRDPRGELASISIVNRDEDALNLQFDLEIGDRIKVFETQVAHAAEYFIVGESHDWRDGGTEFRTTFYLEPTSTYIFWTLGIEGRSELGETTNLAY